MLKADSTLVFDFDSVGQTPLHWAAKRDQPEIIDELVNNGAQVDIQDIVTHNININNKYRVEELHYFWPQEQIIYRL